MQVRETKNDIELLKRTVERYFKVYDISFDQEIAVFYCQIYNIETIGKRFVELRKELKKIGYTPLLRYEKGEHTILVMKKPRISYRSVKVNIIMLFLTLFSTIWAGSIYWASRYDWDLDSFKNYFTVLLHPNYVLFGALSFALPLMTILGAHELAHYFAAKKHDVDASLPFFLPVPPIIGPFGTFGAFISMREPIPNKKALVDIGAAGPIAGFLVAIPVTILGLIFSDIYAVSAPKDAENVVYIGVPLVFTALEKIFPIPSGMLMHPTLFAGWVGLFVTGLNLLPCGQLDGGHIARALAGEKSKYLSYATIAGMIAFSYIFQGWFILALLIIFLGLKHPPPLDDLSSLDSRRKAIGIFSILMLLLCFHPAPLIPAQPLHYGVELNCNTLEQNISVEEIATFEVMVKNSGDLDDTINVSARLNLSESLAMVEYWNIILENNKSKEYRKLLGGKQTENISLTLKKGNFTNLTLIVQPPKNATYLENISIEISAISENKTEKKAKLKLHTTILQDYGICINTEEKQRILSPGNTTVFNIEIKNTGRKNEKVELLFEFLELNATNWNISFILDSKRTYYNNSSILRITNLSNRTKKTILLNVTALKNQNDSKIAKIRISGKIIGVKHTIGIDELMLIVKRS